ncbi:hypothetical protein SAMN03097699_1666 [Flavobacteriaceae bacterium MAR_2010_188]|nr:hypothetical protein SAMN03097699_1666 [Flavobacteriaceae bacterium MAR_2010_188]
MIELYLIGICILIVAIIANVITQKLGITSWYDLIESFQIYGKNTFSKLDLLDYFWLLIGYPMVLGIAYLLGKFLYEFIF